MRDRIKRKKNAGIAILLTAAMILTAFPGLHPLRAKAEENPQETGPDTEIGFLKGDAGETGQGEYIAEFCEPAEPESEKQYIVKYRDSMVSLMEDEEAPFEVVGREKLRGLLQQDALEWYEEDGDMVLLDDLPDGTEAASAYYDADLQWNLEMIRADTAFQKKCLGTGVRVGVLDSGVNPHADFGDRLLKGSSFEETADSGQNQGDTSDEYGHGTRVAGLIAAAGEDGFIGAAPGAWIVPLKCTNGKTVKVSAVCRAVYSGINDYNCDVLNLSLGTQQNNRALEEAVEYAEQQNVTVVSAVGNNGTSAVYYPAAYDTVIGVGSVTREGKLYYHSNQNESVFLTAPGANVRSTAFRGGYADSTGCSFAVPQVAAAAAVMKGIDSNLTPARIRGILSETATDKGPEGYDTEYGYGILNLGGCVDALPDSGIQNDDTNEDPGDGSQNETGEQGQQDSNDNNDNPEKTDSQDQQEDPSEDPNGQTDPDGKDSWTLCPRDESCVLNSFSDLDPDAWYHDGIHRAVEKEIMNGFEDGTFRPDGSTSRAMIVTILWRMEGKPDAPAEADSRGVPTFGDVPEGRWYTEAVRWASSKGIVNGYSEAAFGPDDAVTREQLAAILLRYWNTAGSGAEPWTADGDILGRFLDTEQIAGWALDAMRWAVSAGLIQGIDEEHICPASGASRAQAATILTRYASL